MLSINKVSFTGYDTRPLQGILSRGGFPNDRGYFNLINEISEILNEENVDVFVQNTKEIHKNKLDSMDQTYAPFWIFGQDTVTFLPNKTIMANKNFRDFFDAVNDSFDELSKFFNMPLAKNKKHFDGGNFFFVKDGNKDVIIMGKDETIRSTPADRTEVFGNKKICFVSQPDFHIDLSVRPLNQKRILVHSPKMMLQGMEKGIRNASEIYETTGDKEVGTVLSKLIDLYVQTKAAQEQYDMNTRYKTLSQDLKYNRFDVIRVPGIVEIPDETFTPHPANNKNYLSKLVGENIKYSLNYMNAIVHERADGSMVYIAGKSNLDKKLGITPEIEQKIGFSFEKMFKDSLKGIIKEEDIHFVGGDFMQNVMDRNGGGLHCLFSEIPA